jgi:predicted dehydrogenase
MGILSTANIARSFIAGVAPSETLSVTAIASRDLAKATRFAAETGVASSYGSYEELLADPEVDAIYNPPPNSLHAQWSIRASEAKMCCAKSLWQQAPPKRGPCSPPLVFIA